MTPTAAQALRTAATLGPFFALDQEAGPGWVGWPDLVGGPGPLRARSREVGAVLGPEADDRVVGSLVHLGVVARLLSPAVGAALVAGVLPVAGQVQLRLSGSNPLPMSWSVVRAVPVGTAQEVAAALAEHWLDPWVHAWSARVAATGVSLQVLTGNVVSAVAGAVTIASTARPDLGDLGNALVDDLVARGPLAGTGIRSAAGRFTRRSCCLFYRLPGAGTCADCVLDAGRA